MPVVFGLNPLYRKLAWTALVVMPGPLKACSQRPSRMNWQTPVSVPLAAAARYWPGSWVT